MKWITSHLIAVFIALGGIGIIVSWLIKGEKAAIDRLMDKVLKNPDYRATLIKWRPQIEQAIKGLDEVDAKLDAAAEEEKKS